ncbi:MAG: hypothetical protein IJ679_02835 [Lachnospiraceae bacterium]|nr:hypothetical protein [Lachnospiraceae bacterium]
MKKNMTAVALTLVFTMASTSICASWMPFSCPADRVLAAEIDSDFDEETDSANFEENTDNIEHPRDKEATEEKESGEILKIDGEGGADDFIRYLQDVVFRVGVDSDASEVEIVDPGSEKTEWIEKGVSGRAYYDVLNKAEKALYDYFDLEAEIFMDDPDFVRLREFGDVDEESYKFKINSEKVTGAALIPIPLYGLDAYEGDSISLERAMDIYDVFFMDNPQYYFMYNSVSSFTNDEGEAVAVAPYVYDAFSAGLESGRYATIDRPASYEDVGMRIASFGTLKKRVENACDEIKNTEAWKAGTTPAKLRAVHDWLISHVDYDQFGGGYVSLGKLEASRYANTYEKLAIKNNDEEIELYHENCAKADEDYSFSQSAFSVFGRELIDNTYPIFYGDEDYTPRYYGEARKDAHTGKTIAYFAICQGYCAGFDLLCRYLDLSATVAFNEGHCWNLAKLEDVDGYEDGWYHIDATWDDEGGKPEEVRSPKGIAYQYFLLPNSGDFADGHDYSSRSEKWIDSLKEVSSLPDSLYPAQHFYARSDNFSSCYFLKENNGTYSLYLAKGEGNHTAAGAAYSGTRSQIQKIFDEKGLTGIVDSPGYMKHTDTVAGSRTTTGSNTQTAAYSSSAAASTSNTKSGGSSSSKQKTYRVGRGNGKAYYRKGKKNKAHYFETAAGKNAKEIVIPATVKFKKKKWKVAYVDSYAFTGADKLQRVVVGKNVEVIQKEAFFGCKRLKEIVVYSTKLGASKCKHALDGSGIKTVYVPEKKLAAYKKIFGAKKVRRIKDKNE